jgi:hypothetical protein
MSLQQAWERYAPEWKHQARLYARLPIYRNWSYPAIDLLRGIKLSGLTVFFLSDLSWLPGVVLKLDLEAMKKRNRGEPFGFRTIYHNPKQVDLIPVFRETDVEGGISPSSKLQLPFSEGIEGFLEGLGYRLRKGSLPSLEGRLITMPCALDPEDMHVEAIRVACHREWARRDHAGYLGAEMTFGLIAAELGMDCSNLGMSKPLKDEILRSSPLSFVTESLLATVIAGQLLGDALGTEARTSFFDTMTFPESLEIEPENTILVDDFFK